MVLLLVYNSCAFYISFIYALSTIRHLKTVYSFVQSIIRHDKKFIYLYIFFFTRLYIIFTSISTMLGLTYLAFIVCACVFVYGWYQVRLYVRLNAFYLVRVLMGLFMDCVKLICIQIILQCLFGFYYLALLVSFFFFPTGLYMPYLCPCLVLGFGTALGLGFSLSFVCLSLVYMICCLYLYVLLLSNVIQIFIFYVLEDRRSIKNICFFNFYAVNITVYAVNITVYAVNITVSL